MSSSSASEASLCYLCGVSQGTITVQSTNIIDLMETIRKREIVASIHDLVCAECANLFVTMANTHEKSVTDKAFALMRAKVVRLSSEPATPKPIPENPRFTCTTCGYKTFHLEHFPSHSCTDTIKSFTVDYLKDDPQKQEELFQELLVEAEDSIELKTTMIVAGVEREVLEARDSEGNIIDKEEVVQAIIEGKNIEPYYVTQKSSDEEN